VVVDCSIGQLGTMRERTVAVASVVLLVRGTQDQADELERELRAAGVSVSHEDASRARGTGELAEAVVAQLVAAGGIEAVRAVVGAFRRRHGAGSVSATEDADGT
jgi:hypothetical protein